MQMNFKRQLPFVIFLIVVLSIGYNRIQTIATLQQLSNTIIAVNNNSNTREQNATEKLKLDVCKNSYPFQVMNTTSTPLTLFHHPPDEDVHVSKRIHASNGDPSKLFEANIRNQMLQVLSKTQNPLILDIGANIGLHTMFFAHAGYRVHAFEPFLRNLNIIQCSIRANHFVPPQLVLNLACQMSKRKYV